MGNPNDLLLACVERIEMNKAVIEKRSIVDYKN